MKEGIDGSKIGVEDNSKFLDQGGGIIETRVARAAIELEAGKLVEDSEKLAEAKTLSELLEGIFLKIKSEQLEISVEAMRKLVLIEKYAIKLIEEVRVVKAEAAIKLTAEEKTKIEALAAELTQVVKEAAMRKLEKLVEEILATEKSVEEILATEKSVEEILAEIKTTQEVKEAKEMLKQALIAALEKNLQKPIQEAK